MKKNIIEFMQNVVEVWNPDSKEVTKIIVPPISLHDEIKTDGYGMAVIELLELVGILIRTKDQQGNTKGWELHRDWEKKRLYLCVDGLSLERHRLFQKKVSTVTIELY